jgi:hypothetical protein
MADRVSVSWDLEPMRVLLETVRLGLEDLETIHEWMLIAAQADIFRRWRSLAPPLSPLTLATRQRGGDKPLWDTGMLINSITGGASGLGEVSRAEGSLNIATETFGQVGTSLPHAPLLFFGGTVRSRGGRSGRARNLAVPLDRESARYDSPLDDPRPLTFIPNRRTHRGGVLAIASPRSGDRALAKWWLTPEIYIPGRNPLPTPQEAESLFRGVGNRYVRVLAQGQSPRRLRPAA